MVYNVNLGRTGLLDMDKIKNASDIPDNIGYKPYECLWASRQDCKFGWEAWCERECPHWLSIEHAEVEISNNARVLIIDSEESLDKLLLFKCDPCLLGEGEIDGQKYYHFEGYIDWANVSKYYDVVEFRLDDYFNTHNILGCVLDCDSVTILNKEVITEIHNPATVTLRKEIDHIEIAPGTTHINEYEFSGYENVRSIVIPEGVTEIGEGAFYECTHLENVSFPSTLKKIDKDAFEFCPNLRKIILPDGIEELGRDAFEARHYIEPERRVAKDLEYEHDIIMYKGENIAAMEFWKKNDFGNIKDAFDLAKSIQTQPEKTEKKDTVEYNKQAILDNFEASLRGAVISSPQASVSRTKGQELKEKDFE